jgi:hypothetical protein
MGPALTFRDFFGVPSTHPEFFRDSSSGGTGFTCRGRTSIPHLRHPRRLKPPSCSRSALTAVNALASYAKMADDDSLRMAHRIRARAVRRSGELLKQFNNTRARTDLNLVVVAKPFGHDDRKEVYQCAQEIRSRPTALRWRYGSGPMRPEVRNEAGGSSPPASFTMR